MNVTIIGTGKMARGIATRLLAGGHNVSFVEHTPGKAETLADELKSRRNGGSVTPAKPGALPGEVVVLAIPYRAVEPVIEQYNGQLAGKILVDITNPVNFQAMEPLFPDSSGAEQIARLVPESTRVVKAFNTVFASTLPSGVVADQPLDIFIAGDDADAKAKIARLIESGGMRSIDAGPLVRARQLEALGLLHIAIQSTNNTGYKSAIKVLV